MAVAVRALGCHLLDILLPWWVCGVRLLPMPP